MKFKINLKTVPIMLKPNYLLLPCTQTDSMEDFNEVFFYYRDRNKKEPFKLIKRTKSGGISLRGFKGHQWDLRNTKACIELTVLDYDGCFRLQYRNNINKDLEIDNSIKISGRIAYEKFKEALKEEGIKLDDYALTPEEGLKEKEKIEKPMIFCPKPLYQGEKVVFHNVYHIDIRSSYPFGLKQYRPEFGAVIDKWFKLKEEGHKEYKAYLNLLIGMMQSAHIDYKHADISRFAINLNNKRLREKAQELKDKGDMVLLYNTDGIWFIGDYVPESGNELGDFRVDYCAKDFRIKSNGAYEFIDQDGVYHPVIRGKTRLDRIKPREEWGWGDIFRKETNIISYTIDYDNGIQEA